MDWLQVFTIIFSLAGVIYWFRSDINEKIAFTNEKIASLDSDIKMATRKFEDDMRAQSARTDQLYLMFIDLLKDFKNSKRKTNP